MNLSQRMEEYITAEANDAHIYKNLSQIAPKASDKLTLMQISREEQAHSNNLIQAYKTMFNKNFTPIIKDESVNASMFYDVINDRILDESKDFKKYSSEYLDAPNNTLKTVFFNNMIDENTHALRLINILASDNHIDEMQEDSQLNKNMRNVWEQHVWWTRSVIIAITQKLPDVNATVNRLMQNPSDIAKLFMPYYPMEVTNEINRLFTEHLSIGGDIITALNNNQVEKAAELDKKWYANADDIAKFFASINPHYDYKVLKDMMYKHLDLTKDELAYYLESSYGDSIRIFDMIENEALMMADYFTNGLMKQFEGQ